MKFRLRSAHYFPGDVWLPGDKENESFGDDRGTVVGDGTKFPVFSILAEERPKDAMTPTTEMEPLDEEAEQAMEELREWLAAGGRVVNPVEALPLGGEPVDDYDKRYLPGFAGTPRPQGKGKEV